MATVIGMYALRIGPARTVAPAGGRATATATAARPVQQNTPVSRDGAKDPYATTQAYQQALQALDTIPVKGRAPMTGYDRDRFGPAWSDDNTMMFGHNGCDTRNDVLRRDLAYVETKPDNQCVVVRGLLHDPYTGTDITFLRGGETSARVQIDHVVALADAWQTGAQSWPAGQRQNYANDPDVLIAVQGDANQAKGAADAASWLPPNKAFRCAYVSRQVAIKQKYGLWMTGAERDAVRTVLTGCV